MINQLGRILKKNNLTLNRALFHHNRNITDNILHLGIFQSINYLFPLLTLPYLFRVLGVENMGLVALAQVLTNYFNIFIDYGFDYSATRKISVHRDEHLFLCRIFTSVTLTKTVLFLISWIILIILCLSIPGMNAHYPVYLVTGGLMAGQVLFPFWLFQGTDHTRYISTISALVKGCGLIAIFLLIKSPRDFMLYVFINASIGILYGITGFAWAIRVFRIIFVWPSLSDIRENLSDGWHLFVSNLSLMVCFYSNIILLGMLTNNTIVGYYSLVERPVTAIRGFVGVVFKSLYPQVCRIAATGYKKSIVFIKKSLLPFYYAFFLLSATLFIAAEYIVLLLSGQSLSISVTLLRIICFVPFIMLIYTPPYQLLLAFNLQKDYFKVLLVSAAVNIFLNILLCTLFNAYGAAVSALLTEILITSGLYFVLYKKRTLLINQISNQY